MPASPYRLILPLTLLAGGLLAAPATGTSPPPRADTDAAAHAAGTTRVGVFNNRFSPRTVRIRRGSTVVWTWRDGGVPHNVRPRGGGRGSRTLSRKGRRFSHTFRRRGSFRYICTVHPDSMRMSVRVR